MYAHLAQQQRENTTVQEKVASVQQDKSIIQNRLERMTQDHANMVASHQKRVSEKTALMAENTTLHQENANLRAENAGFLQRTSDNGNKVMDLESDKESLTSDKKSLEERVEVLSQDKQALEIRVKALESERDGFKARLDRNAAQPARRGEQGRQFTHPQHGGEIRLFRGGEAYRPSYGARNYGQPYPPTGYRGLGNAPTRGYDNGPPYALPSHSRGDDERLWGNGCPPGQGWGPGEHINYGGNAVETDRDFNGSTAPGFGAWTDVGFDNGPGNHPPLP